MLQALQVGGLCGENWSPQKPALDAASELRPGSVISHYQIEGVLGSGGFATVFRAFDQNLHRTVALKVLRNQEGQLLDLQSEARAAAALTHPNVCSVYAVDDQFGVSMIVMEFLEGRTLAQKMNEGPLGVQEVKRIGCQVAAAIAAAHAAGIVHGDLKPSNLILADDGTVKVLDFGLAVRTRTCTDCPTLSELPPAKRFPAGTPGYMAPELLEGVSPSAKSDVFSIGWLLYDLLAGTENGFRKTPIEARQAIACSRPEELAEPFQEPFRSLLGRMLVIDPDRRTITPQEIQEVLES